jgi:hypothetical protein
MMQKKNREGRDRQNEYGSSSDTGTNTRREGTREAKSKGEEGLVFWMLFAGSGKIVAWEVDGSTNKETRRGRELTDTVLIALLVL